MCSCHPRMRALVLIIVGACAGEDGVAEPVPSCTDGIVGDLDAPPEVEILVRDADGNARLAEDMEPIDLILPPQGGKVLLVAPRVRNMDACSMRVTATLRDECTNRILGLEARPLRFAPTDDGWAVPVNPQLVSNWSNVPACPSAAAVRDIEGEPYLLTITVEDSDGRTASASRRVVPTCAEAEHLERCLCECDGSYRLGEICTPDDDSEVTAVCS
jgi:hypothetical protein